MSNWQARHDRQSWLGAWVSWRGAHQAHVQWALGVLHGECFVLISQRFSCHRVGIASVSPCAHWDHICLDPRVFQLSWDKCDRWTCGSGKAPLGSRLSNCAQTLLQVLEMFILVLQQCHKENEDKWKRLSRQIADIILPMLAKQQVCAYRLGSLLHSDGNLRCLWKVGGWNQLCLQS